MADTRDLQCNIIQNSVFNRAKCNFEIYSSPTLYSACEKHDTTEDIKKFKKNYNLQENILHLSPKG